MTWDEIGAAIEQARDNRVPGGMASKEHNAHLGSLAAIHQIHRPLNIPAKGEWVQTERHEQEAYMPWAEHPDVQVVIDALVRMGALPEANRAEPEKVVAMPPLETNAGWGD